MVPGSVSPTKCAVCCVGPSSCKTWQPRLLLQLYFEIELHHRLLQTAYPEAEESMEIYSLGRWHFNSDLKNERELVRQTTCCRTQHIKDTELPETVFSKYGVNDSTEHYGTGEMRVWLEEGWCGKGITGRSYMIQVLYGHATMFGVEAEGDGSHCWTSSRENKYLAFSFWKIILKSAWKSDCTGVK